MPITMSDQRPSRKKAMPARYRQNESGDKLSSLNGAPRARRKAASRPKVTLWRGVGGAIPTTAAKTPLSQGASNAIGTPNRQGEAGTSIGGASNSQTDDSISQKVNMQNMKAYMENLGVTLGDSRAEVTNFAKRVTNTLCALFTILTPPQVKDIEESNKDEIVENDVLLKCINEAKSAATIRETAFRDVLTNDSRRKQTKQTESHPVNNTGSIGTSTSRTEENGTPETNVQAAGGDERRATGAAERMKLQHDMDRKKNIIISGVYDGFVKFKGKKYDEDFVQNLITHLGCRDRLKDLDRVIRLGKRNPRKNRLILVRFFNEEAANEVLNRSPKLASSDAFCFAFVNEDRSREQRQMQGRRGSKSVANSAMGASEHSVKLPVSKYHNGSSGKASNNIDLTPSHPIAPEVSSSGVNENEIDLANENGLDTVEWITLSEVTVLGEAEGTAPESLLAVAPERLQRLENVVREQLIQDVEDSPEVSVENESEQLNIESQEAEAAAMDDEGREGAASSTADRVEREPEVEDTSTSAEGNSVGEVERAADQVDGGEADRVESEAEDTSTSAGGDSMGEDGRVADHEQPGGVDQVQPGAAGDDTNGNQQYRDNVVPQSGNYGVEGDSKGR